MFVLYCLIIPFSIYFDSLLVVEAANRFVRLSIIAEILILLFIGLAISMGRHEYLERRRKLQAGEDEHEE